MCKKFITIILGIAVSVSLVSGCAQKVSSVKKTEPSVVIVSQEITDNDPQTTEGDIMDQLYSGEVIKIESGDSFDLDWDGESDTITFAVVEKEDVSEDEYYLQVNEEKITEGFYMEEVNCYLANVSNCNVLLVEALGVVDIWTDVYTYYEGNLELLGSIPYSSPDRDLTVETDARGNVIHADTFSGYLVYRAEYILAYNMLPENREYIMVEVPAGMHPIGEIFSANADVPVYSYRYDNQVEWVIENGDPVIIVACDGLEFMYVESMDRLYAGWIRMDDRKETIYVTDGSMQSIYEVFPEFGYGG
jgi:hypothetical protein